MINGAGRQLYRLNIKLHGALFRKAKEVVGLEPEDCFPLATYKIASALRKQDEEHLPYIFIVVTGTSHSAATIAEVIPRDFVLATYFGKLILKSGKRDLEEQVVLALIEGHKNLFNRVRDDLRSARWYVFSARKAIQTMKANLFERVYALRTRNFTRSYSNAEIDMHFSFSADMIGLDNFLDLASREGHFKIAGMLERGTI